jgi:hypothetical protein
MRAVVLYYPRDYALRAGHIGAIFIAKGFEHHPLFSKYTKTEKEARPDKSGCARKPIWQQ